MSAQGVGVALPKAASSAPTYKAWCAARNVASVIAAI